MSDFYCLFCAFVVNVLCVCCVAALCIVCVFAVNCACVCRERFLCSFCGRTWTRTRRWTWKTGRPWGAPPQWRRRNPDCSLWTPSEGQSVPATLPLSVVCQSVRVWSLSVCWRVFTVSQLACGHCQSVRVWSLSVCWRVFTVSLLACGHCQSVRVCSLSVCWRVFIVSQLACVHCQSVRVCSLSVSWRVYTASQLAHVHSQRVSVSSRVFTVDRHGEPGEGSPSDGQSVLTAPSLSDLCLCGQHGYGTKEKDSPSEDQLVLTTLYLCVDCRYNEPGANHSSSIHLQRVS